jgi:hypothetical protein
MDRSKIYPEMGVLEREKALKNVATVHEHLAKYSRELDDNTLAKIREDKCNADIAIERLKEQQKVANDGYKSKIKDLQNKASGWMKEIETGKREEEGLLSGIVDQEEGRVYFYDRYGDMIKSRPILPEEKVTQGNLFAHDEAQQLAEAAVFGENVEVEVTENSALIGQPVIEDLPFEDAVETEPGEALVGEPDNYKEPEEEITDVEQEEKLQDIEGGEINFDNIEGQDFDLEQD